MKNKTALWTVGVLAAGFMGIQPPLGAEVIYGEVRSLNLPAASLSVRRIDPATGRTSRLKVSVPRNAEVEGISSPWDLKAGDRVMIDARRSGILGGFEANTIEAVQDPRNL